MSPGRYATGWISWGQDRPDSQLAAPPGRFRVCAYHVDFDERPTCFQDVASLEEGQWILDNFPEARGRWNVDFAAVFDERGESRAHNCPWA